LGPFCLSGNCCQFINFCDESSAIVRVEKKILCGYEKVAILDLGSYRVAQNKKRATFFWQLFDFFGGAGGRTPDLLTASVPFWVSQTSLK